MSVLFLSHYLLYDNYPKLQNRVKKIQFRIFWNKGIDLQNLRKKEEVLASSFRLSLWK